jgi:hypothetical protein
MASGKNTAFSQVLLMSGYNCAYYLNIMMPLFDNI